MTPSHDVLYVEVTMSLCNRCLLQILRYNDLLNEIRQQLTALERGIKGFVVMSSDLEEVFQCIYDARVPSSWQKVCVISLVQPLCCQIVVPRYFYWYRFSDVTCWVSAKTAKLWNYVIYIFIFIHQKAGSSKEQTSSIQNKSTNNRTHKRTVRLFVLLFCMLDVLSLIHI